MNPKPKRRALPSQESLREFMDYLPSGTFLCKQTGRIIGAPRGNPEYRPTHRGIAVHRLIWIWHNGEIPDGLEVEHRNRIKNDNRIENLRLATHAQNAMNTVVVNRKTALPWGIRPLKDGRYQAFLSHDGAYYSSLHHSKEEAFAAHIQLSITHHGEFSPYLSTPETQSLEFWANLLLLRLERDKQWNAQCALAQGR